jgi:hypothetical protein
MFKHDEVIKESLANITYFYVTSLKLQPQLICIMLSINLSTFSFYSKLAFNHILVTNMHKLLILLLSRI